MTNLLNMNIGNSVDKLTHRLKFLFNRHLVGFKEQSNLVQKSR